MENLPDPGGPAASLPPPNTPDPYRSDNACGSVEGKGEVWGIVRNLPEFFPDALDPNPSGIETRELLA